MRVSGPTNAPLLIFAALSREKTFFSNLIGCPSQPNDCTKFFKIPSLTCSGGNTIASGGTNGTCSTFLLPRVVVDFCFILKGYVIVLREKAIVRYE